jgi:hypothetical protein
MLTAVLAVGLAAVVVAAIEKILKEEEKKDRELNKLTRDECYGLCAAFFEPNTKDHTDCSNELYKLTR